MVLRGDSQQKGPAVFRQLAEGGTSTAVFAPAHREVQASVPSLQATLPPSS